MATDLTKLVEQLGSVSGDLTKAADGVSPADVSKEFGAALDGVISKLQSVSMSLGSGEILTLRRYDYLCKDTVITSPNKLRDFQCKFAIVTMAMRDMSRT